MASALFTVIELNRQTRTVGIDAGLVSGVAARGVDESKFSGQLDRVLQTDQPSDDKYWAGKNVIMGISSHHVMDCSNLQGSPIKCPSTGHNGNPIPN